jgi:hypothetical protein
MEDMTGLHFGLQQGCRLGCTSFGPPKDGWVAFRVVYTRMLQPSRRRVAPLEMHFSLKRSNCSGLHLQLRTNC